MTVLPRLQINGDRLNHTINRLAKIGQLPNGDICRLAFTPDDLQARYLVQQWMIEAGMTVRSDAAGNLIGRYPGTVDGAPAIATGSHIDTVPSGGPYDGVLGVLAGIEVVKVLSEQGIHLRHPLEVIVFTDEESSMVGAQAMAGMVKQHEPDRYQPKIGLPIQDCLEKIGGDWQALNTARRTQTDILAFVELHVEQGPVLEKTGKEIGIVQGVVGMVRKIITITGQANHAGTTPMDSRQDALLAAAQVILTVNQLALEMPGEPVATVGYLTVEPNAVNIVPGRVELSVDMRDLSQATLDTMLARLEASLRAIAATTHTHIDITPLICVEPTPAADYLQTLIEATCQDLGFSYGYLPSRAGHDSMEMGRFTDMGMIFVPSESGISHSGREYTSPQQCIQGAEVLLHTIVRLDAMSP